MTTLLFFILALATARLTWLITEDHLPPIAKARDWIIGRNPHGTLAYLVNCWWCTSVYVAAGAAAYATWVLHIGDWRDFLLLWPALSFAGVALMSVVDTVQNFGTDE